MQFSTRQSGFEHVAGIHRAFAFPRTNHGVQLINEEDDIAFFFR
ncbi:Uncharacterised protein [Vibrio cholerae]|nr:Uncharacterised protein [Vibrio cholerae]